MLKNKQPTEYFGFYRAEVINNKDPQKYGRCLVYIPLIMPTIDPNDGLWAYPANNPMGGRNNDETESFYCGTCYIPRIGSYVLVFFEGGNINRPYYMGGIDVEISKVLPENQVGTNYEDKWTIFKAPSGRCIIISDDPDDERLEITGKKRKLKTPPTGDEDSVYEIDGNQTTILLDERDGKEKILLRSRKGDFINFDITDRQLHISLNREIVLKSNSTIQFEAPNINMKADTIIADTGGNGNIFLISANTVMSSSNFYRLISNLYYTPTTSNPGTITVPNVTPWNLQGGRDS